MFFIIRNKESAKNLVEFLAHVSHSRRESTSGESKLSMSMSMSTSMSMSMSVSVSMSASV